VLPAIDSLYLSHGPAVLRRAQRILNDHVEAQEVLHDVFTSLIENPSQFRGQSSIMTYLYSMTTHAALSRLRKTARRRELLEITTKPQEMHMTEPAQARVELRELLASLPEELAQVAIAYHLDRMSQDEIAATMGCSRQWIGKQLARLHSITRSQQ
jgi:RNA polymerase sigma factor (sigma-70 family)